MARLTPVLRVGVSSAGLPIADADAPLAKDNDNPAAAMTRLRIFTNS
jgi:hypothetical protein